MFIDNNTENERLKKGMGSHMTAEDKKMLDRINESAYRVLKSNDSKNARVSYQLDKLKPVMEEIAKEQNTTVEDIFVRFMDLESQAANEKRVLNTVGSMIKNADVKDFDIM